MKSTPQAIWHAALTRLADDPDMAELMPALIDANVRWHCDQHSPRERLTFDGYVRRECSMCGAVLATDRKPERQAEHGQTQAELEFAA